jgi:hypothetical protein
VLDFLSQTKSVTSGTLCCPPTLLCLRSIKTGSLQRKKSCLARINTQCDCYRAPETICHATFLCTSCILLLTEMKIHNVVILKVYKFIFQ